ncbi:MAG: type II secretion system protein [Alphaproteobacteria bacterium]|nr:type II secretion system protein [Alphaproteobacteria bacterium]
MMGRQAGFSLIEMSIVLVILGLIVGSGVGIGSSYYSRSKVAEARVMMDRAERALRDYAAAYRALPCPNTDGTGIADGTTTCTGNQVNGVLPWATLGLRREEATDPWKHYLTYRVFDGANGLTTPGNLDMSKCSTTAPASVTAATTCSDSVTPAAWLLNRGLTVVDPSGASEVIVNVPANSTGAAYFLASHGETGIGGMTAASVYHSGTLSTHETPNAASLALDNATGVPTGHSGFVSRRFGSGGSGGRFDDLVRHPDIMSFAVSAGLGPRDVFASRVERDDLTADGTVTGTDSTPAVVTPTVPVATAGTGSVILNKSAIEAAGYGVETNGSTGGLTTMALTHVTITSSGGEITSRESGANDGMGVGTPQEMGGSDSLTFTFTDGSMDGYTITFSKFGGSDQAVVTGYLDTTLVGTQNWTCAGCNQGAGRLYSYTGAWGTDRFNKLVVSVGAGDFFIYSLSATP